MLFCVVFFAAATVTRISGGSEWERLVGRLARLSAVHLQLEMAQGDKRRRRRLSGRHKSPFSDSAPNCFFRFVMRGKKRSRRRRRRRMRRRRINIRDSCIAVLEKRELDGWTATRLSCARRSHLMDTMIPPPLSSNHTSASC